MSNELLRNIVITDDDIDWVETILNGVSFDDCRRDIIKNMETVDIQAFPGSGKTTVLIAKLAILARKWPYSDKGICVLSHTNVARDEIEERLGTTEVGKKLLRYPHFVGTLHSFFDTYASMPWLRSQRIKVKIIDSAIVKELRWKRLNHGTRYYLENNGFDAGCCQANSLPVQVNIGRAGPKSPSYINTAAVVSSSLSNGEFTFDEMLLYAKDALCKCPTLPSHMMNRFPVLYIDEAQDTSIDQWNLVNLAFPVGISHIRQCYGDSNQAIFSSYNTDEEPNVFPNGTPLTIPDSKRFGPSLASLANRVALSKQQMNGDSTAFNQLADNHTVFLFDKNNTHSVLSAYTSLVLSCFTDTELSDNEKYGCHVIGMVHRESDNNPTHFPQNVHDYWEGYDSNYSVRTPSPKLLIAYFRAGHQAFNAGGNMTLLADWVSKGLRRYLNIYNNRSIPVNSDAFRALCHELSAEELKDFRKSFLSLAVLDIATEVDWQIVTEEIIRMAVDVFGLPAVWDNFLQWEPLGTEELDAKQNNILYYFDETTERSLPLNFGSIHSVKGRTHLSTLVIETFWYDPNIGSLLPWLCGCPPNKRIGKRIMSRMKCHYVAFTRARALLCVAIPKEAVASEQIAALQDNGWRIADLTM
jgi:hypothetical protein